MTYISIFPIGILILILLFLAKEKTEWFFYFLLFIFPIQRTGILNEYFWIFKLILTGIILIFLYFRQNMNNSGLEYRQASSIFILLICLIILSFSMSSQKQISMPFTFQIINNFMFFFIFSSFLSYKGFKPIFKVLLVSNLSAVALGIIQYIIIKGHFPYLRFFIPSEAVIHFFDNFQMMGYQGVRISSFFYHNNQFGNFLSVNFGLLLPLFLFLKDKRLKVVLFFLLCGNFICLFLTQSRGALFLIAIQAFLMFCFLPEKFIKNIKWFSIMLVLFILTIFVIAPENFYGFFSRIHGGGLSNRNVLWQYGIILAKENFLFGVGPGCASYYVMTRFPMLDDLFQAVLDNVVNEGIIVFSGNHSHQYYINIVLETGLLFGIFLTLFCLWILKKGITTYHTSHKNFTRIMALILSVSFVTAFIRGFFESHCFFYDLETGYLFSFMTASVLFINERKKL